ncbi:MAG: Do family serine endopeptidase [Rhodoblastus sp.]|nr:Do family serine endopeptidase [Rhodoblastus sp.]
MTDRTTDPHRAEGFALPRPGVRARVFLLGAVSALALGGAALNTSIVTLPARAEAALNQSIAPAGPASFADLVDRVKGAVVSVRVKTVQTASADGDDEHGMPQFAPGDPLERFFKQFGGRGGQFRNKPHKGMALGSGFIISSDGYVVTNNHVVQNATEVEIQLDGGKTVPAKIVGTDKKTDLALLKIKDSGTYPFVQFGSKTPRVGDWVVAVGNPFGLGGTVTAGIVSARGRDIGSGPYDDFLQIDAPVNRGNSGGPTFDANGQVVGVNTAIFSPSGGSVGIGFAIPADVAKQVVGELKDKGVVSRGYIGVQIQPVTQDIAESLGLKDTKGALVAEAKTGPAAEAGVKSGDVIVAVNGEKIDGPRELARKIAGIGPDKKVELTYMRGGSEKTVSLTLAKLPGERQAKADREDGGSPASLSSYGLELAPATAVPGAGKNGVVVADIDPDGLGAQKGLRSGDVILEAAGKPVSSPAQVVAALKDARAEGHKAVLLRVKTGDATHFVALATRSAS